MGHKQTVKESRTANMRLAIAGGQWLIEALCFHQTSVLADSSVLLNARHRQAQKRYRQAMKRLQFLCIIFILCSCGQPTESAPTDEPFASRPYFDFDKIIHYHIDINEDEVMTLNTKTSKTRLDSLLADILIQYANENLTDTTLLNSLESLPFKKTVIDSLLFKDFREIFSEKKHVDPIYSSCLATWRDILIFKKSQSTIGIAKICFDCNRSSIVGTKVNTEEFGQSGDYQKLFRLLNRK